jgi:hypothetical protein
VITLLLELFLAKDYLLRTQGVINCERQLVLISLLFLLAMYPKVRNKIVAPLQKKVVVLENVQDPHFFSNIAMECPPCGGELQIVRTDLIELSMHVRFCFPGRENSVI